MEYISYNAERFKRTTFFERLPESEKASFRILTKVFHFKTNNYVLEKLIDWKNIPEDPIYKLVFPRKEMIGEAEYAHLKAFEDGHGNRQLEKAFLFSVRQKMFPLVRSRKEGIPLYSGKTVPGAYRSSQKLLLLFPGPMVSTCHSYCSYCFRWITFKDHTLKRDSYTSPLEPVPYLLANPEVSELLFTGADPLVLKSKTLRAYIEPMLEIETIKVISISSKSLAWWPFRFTTDEDAEDLLSLFEEVRAKGKHLNIYAHFTHFHELEHPEVIEAILRIQSTGVIIRTQGPMVKGINDSPDILAGLWEKQVSLGMIPDHLFVEADHNPELCFRLPMGKTLEIFQSALKKCSGIVKTLKGPVFMNDVVRVLLDGTTTVNGEKYFVLKNLQSPPGMDADGEIRLVPYDEETLTLGNLYELFSPKVLI